MLKVDWTMKIALILIAFLIAIIGLLKPDKVPPSLTTILVGLFAVSAIIQVLIERRQAREDARSKYSGVLEHKSKILLSPRKKALPKLEFGDSGSVLVWGGPEGEPIFKIFEDNSLTISIENGQVKVSTLIRSQDGSVIAELVNNEWKVNPRKSFDRNYSRDALEGKDERGDIVLQVILVEDRIQFQGKFYDSSGGGVAFGKMRGPEGIGGAIEITGPNHPRLRLSIEPIFKYPSDLHLGELRYS